MCEKVVRGEKGNWYEKSDILIPEVCEGRENAGRNEWDHLRARDFIVSKVGELQICFSLSFFSPFLGVLCRLFQFFSSFLTYYFVKLLLSRVALLRSCCLAREGPNFSWPEDDDFSQS